MEPADNKTYIRETIEKPRMPFWKKLLLTVFFALVFGVPGVLMLYSDWRKKKGWFK